MSMKPTAGLRNRVRSLTWSYFRMLFILKCLKLYCVVEVGNGLTVHKEDRLPPELHLSFVRERQWTEPVVFSRSQDVENSRTVCDV